MVDLWLILIPILITDIINPVLLAACIFTLGTPRPFSNTTLMLGSFFVTYLIAGIILAIGFEEITEYLKNPSTIDYIIQFIIAWFLLGLAWHIRKTADYQHDPKLDHPKQMSSIGALFMGLQVNLVGLPLALPYFLAIDRILIANISEAKSVVVLILYNIGYIVPFALLILIRWLMEKESDALFRKINRIMLRISDIVLPILLVAISIFLLYDSLSYFYVR